MAKMRVFLQVYVESKNLDAVAEALCRIATVTDVYEVTGEADLIVTVETNDVHEYREILRNEILKVEGIRTTVSSVVTYVHKRDRKMISEA